MALTNNTKYINLFGSFRIIFADVSLLDILIPKQLAALYTNAALLSSIKLGLTLQPVQSNVSYQL